MALPYKITSYATQAIEDITKFSRQEWTSIGRNALIGAGAAGMVGGIHSKMEGGSFGGGFVHGAVLGGLVGGVGSIGVGVIGGGAGIGARRAGHFGINPYGLENGSSAVWNAVRSYRPF